MCFLKSVNIQPVEMSIQSVILHLVYFEKDLKKLDLLSNQFNRLIHVFNRLIF